MKVENLSKAVTLKHTYDGQEKEALNAELMQDLVFNSTDIIAFKFTLENSSKEIEKASILITKKEALSLIGTLVMDRNGLLSETRKLIEELE